MFHAKYVLPCEHKVNPVRFIRQPVQYIPFYDFYEQKENTMNYRLQFFSAKTHPQFFTDQLTPPEGANYAQHISSYTPNFFDLHSAVLEIKLWL